jgi:hypothetical protein
MGLALVRIVVKTDHATPTLPVKRIAAPLLLGTTKSANTRLREWTLGVGKKN